MAENDYSKENRRKSKTIRIVFFVVLIFILSGISSVIGEKYIFPRLAASERFKNWSIFKKAMENVTVINKTEQVTVSESQNISSYTQKSASGVVEIVVRNGADKNPASTSVNSVNGIIVSSDGLLASYDWKFFSDKSAEYKVFLHDGKSYDANVAVADPFSGIVLLKMRGAENLPVVEFIAYEDIKTGMKTALISRSGFNSEVVLRMGITSEWAKSYSIAGPLALSEKLQGVLLADLPGQGITGTSAITGAAAVDQNGDLIGIVGERNKDGAKQSFIVPVNHLRYIVDQYLEKGKIERAFLGVYYQSLSKETAYLAGSNFEKGALIYSPSGQQGLAVIAGSPAEKAGIRMGDIVLSINSEEINPDQNLAYLISKYKSGDEVSLKINRDGKEMNVKATLQ